jgi:hypothetical protein
MLFELTVTQFIKTLHNLSLILDKTEAFCQEKKIDLDFLMNDRLAPDMFNFIRQIQIACDTAKFCASRLTEKNAQPLDDSEKTLLDCKKRIQSTINYLESFSIKDFEAVELKHITTPRWEGKYLTGKEYVIEHAIPNFYFHVTTAYAILRHNGVHIGKKDYLGEMPFKK